jgi:hypothetical protein
MKKIICIKDYYEFFADGVIAPNSTVSSGNEYVVFDKNNIRILKNV